MREGGLGEAGGGGTMEPWSWVYGYCLAEVPIMAATTCKDSKESYDIMG